jgi:hypothetical protein
MRDAKKDLEVCEKATKGPWEYELDIQQLNIRQGYNPMKIIFHAVKVDRNRLLRFNHENGEADARFISLAREALPYWINRAQEAEKLLEEASNFVDMSGWDEEVEHDD